MNSIKLYKEVNLPRITGGFQSRLLVSCEVRFLLVLLLFSLLISPRAGVKLGVISGVISYPNITFHQNDVIGRECAQICGISHGFIPLSGEVIAYSSYFIDKYTMNTISQIITNDVINHF